MDSKKNADPQQQRQVPLTDQEKLERIIDCLKNTSLEESADKAFNNLIVLARDSSPTVVFNHPECITIIKDNIEKNKKKLSPDGIQIIISCFRLLSELCKSNVDRTHVILDALDIDSVTDVISYSNDNQLMTSYQYFVQTVINTLAGVQEMLNKIKQQARLDKERTLTVGEAISTKIHKKVDEDMVKQNKNVLLNILVRLIRRSSSHIITASARDCLLALTMSNVDCLGLSFGVELVEENCLQNLLDIASEVEEISGPSGMDTSSMTHSLVAAVLDKIYSCHDHDKAKDIYREKVQEYLNKRLHNPDMEDKVRATKVFTVLLAGPAEVGNSCVGQVGMIEMIIAMANSDEYVEQKAALDAIIAVASKKDKCTAIAKMGEQVLNQLRKSNNEEIRLRALVGLSKVSSVGSTDASIRPFSREANPNFARDCCEVISRPTPEYNLKQHAIEALAYLSFDGDVKEDLVDNKKVLDALYENIARDINSPVVYSILNIFVNLTNSYDKQEHAPELVQLAKFAQQHIPEEHPKDKRDVLERRIKKLAISGLMTALVKLAEIESKACKDLMGRIVNAMCEIEEIRGILIQQGSIHLLMILAQTDAKQPENSVMLASHALARLGITINPEIAYHGERLISVIRPLKRLLSPNCNAIQNFEGLLALTNVAQASDKARTHILHDNGFSLIEALMFEEHELIRRAAVQCLANLIREPQMVSLYEADNDRVKYLMILCQEEDIETVKAASGALAMLLQVSDKCSEKIFAIKQWNEILLVLLANDNIELVHRAAVVVNCLISNDNPEFGQLIFESNLFEALLALTLPASTHIPDSIKQLASVCLMIGKQRNLIKDTSSLAHIKEHDHDDSDEY